MKTGARLLVFGVGAAAILALSVAVAAHLPGPQRALTSALAAAGLLALSAALLRGLAPLGLPTNRPRGREFGRGLLLGLLLFLGVAGLQSWSVGAAWEFRGWAGVQAAAFAFAAAAVMVLFEELLFRGLLLLELRRAFGEVAALTLSALLFGAYHLIGSQDWGVGALLRFAMPVLGGLLFGWTVLRSGGMAWAIGLHLGGNWVQLGLAGFAPLEGDAAALWRIPIDREALQRLTAPELWTHLPYLLALLLAAGVLGANGVLGGTKRR